MKNRDELLKRWTSKNQKVEDSTPEEERNKQEEQFSDNITNSNREDIQEKLKKPSPATQPTQDEETDNRCNDGKPKTQILAYVGLFFGVSVVDILKGKEIKRITLDVDTFDLAISPDKRFVYVSYYEVSELGVIDICENKEVARVNLNVPPFAGQFPVGVAVLPSGKYIYTANNDTSNISVIEAGRHGWRVVAEVPIGKLPSYITITPDGRLAYVTLRNDNEIAVVDLLANLLIKTIPAGTRPIGIAINKDYVGFATNGGSDDVTAFNAKLAETSPVTIPVSDTPVGVAFSPEGDIAYVTNRLSNTVSVIDVFKHKVIATIPVGTQPVGIALSEDGKYSVVANALDDTVSIIDNEKRKVINTVSVGTFPFSIKIVTLTDKSCKS